MPRVQSDAVGRSSEERRSLMQARNTRHLPARLRSGADRALNVVIFGFTTLVCLAAAAGGVYWLLWVLGTTARDVVDRAVGVIWPLCWIATMLSCAVLFPAVFLLPRGRAGERLAGFLTAVLIAAFWAAELNVVVFMLYHAVVDVDTAEGQRIFYVVLAVGLLGWFAWVLRRRRRKQPTLPAG
jgi:hypothetical protein